jgi:predicted esterase
VEAAQRHFEHLKQFRFYEQGNREQSEILWIVLHGYGQLAFFFLRKFHSLGSPHFLLAPEGMHRFYLNGTSGRVGASWMTKEDRETDISDNLSWLSALIEKEKVGFKKVVLLGFSQGGATAARLTAHRPDLFDHLILWASVFPPDVENIPFQTDKENFFILGNQDPYFSEEDQINAMATYQQKGFQTFTFDGAHDIHENTLKQLAEQLTNPMDRPLGHQ